MSRLRSAIFLAVMAAALVLAGSAEATFPGKNGKIAYWGIYSEPNGEFAGSRGIFLINPDGSGRTNLTPGLPDSYWPAWSPDGTSIAFAGITSSGSSDIFVIRADGTGLRQLTDNHSPYLSEPAWSPDGTKIAFVDLASPAPSFPQIYVMNANGSHQVNISDDPTVQDNQPDWSPDGSKIAFTRSPDFLFHGENVWLMNPDGSGKQNLTQDTSPLSYDTGPDWSPDGKRIAFEHVFDDPPNTVMGGDSYLYVINRDGSGRTELEPTGGFLIHPPAWSPDGRKIALSLGYSSVYVVNQDGSGQIDITPDALQVGNPDWQPIPGPRRGDYKNAAQFCKAERAFWGDQFAGRYGGGPNAYGKCVSRNH